MAGPLVTARKIWPVEVDTARRTLPVTLQHNYLRSGDLPTRGLDPTGAVRLVVLPILERQ